MLPSSSEGQGLTRVELLRPAYRALDTVLYVLAVWASGRAQGSVFLPSKEASQKKKATETT